MAIRPTRSPRSVSPHLPLAPSESRSCPMRIAPEPGSCLHSHIRAHPLKVQPDALTLMYSPSTNPLNVPHFLPEIDVSVFGAKNDPLYVLGFGKSTLRSVPPDPLA